MRWPVLSPSERTRKPQHQTRNWQLCSRSYTTQSRHTLASQTENTRFDPNDQELQTLMSKRDQVHQRVLQTRSTRSTSTAYKDACRLLHLSQTGVKGRQWSCRELLTETT